MLKYKPSEKHSGSSIFTSRVGAITSNYANRWKYSFSYLDGSVQGRFTANSDHARLIYNSNIEEGTIEFRVYDNSNTLVYTFPIGLTTDTLMDAFENGRKYVVRANAIKAKGNFDFSME
jgi:hypothetical protein